MSLINVQQPDKVKIELPSTVLAKLIRTGMLYGSDCKCLDANAKQVIWQLLLTSSTQGNY